MAKERSEEKILNKDNSKDKEAYEAPKVQSMKLSDEAAEALT